MDVLKSALAQRGKIHHFKERGIVPPEPVSESLVHGELTLGELYFELLTIKNNNDPNISRFVNAEGVIYPNIVIPQEIPFVKPTQAISVRGASGGLMTSIQRLLGNTGSQFDGHRYGKKIIRDDRRPKDDQEEPVYKSYLRSAFDFVLRSFNLKHEPLFHLIPDSLRLSTTAPANLFAWHPYQQRFAVALRNDHIRMYDLNLQAWSSLALSHEFQRDICCMQWKPLSGNTLAVGCRYGVCVWSIVSKKVQRPNIAIKEGENDTNSYQEQSAWMTYLKYPGHAPVNCLAWSPCENLLATGSVSSHYVIVWDTSLDQPIPLNEITLGAGITMLKWSPNGHYLFAATTKSTFHIWETKTWRCEKWSNLKTHVQTAAWSSDSRYLAIAASGDSSVHFIEFPSHPPQITAQYIGTEDIGPYSVTLASGREVTVGGNIKELAWDMTGQRLVVSFLDDKQSKKDNADRAHAGTGLEAVKKRLFTDEEGEISTGAGEQSDTCHSLFALFATRSTPVVNLEPMGFIRGPPSSSSPLQMSFRPNFPKGALLTAVWASGKISFFPLYFKTD